MVGEEFLRRIQPLAAARSSVDTPAMQLKPIRPSVNAVVDELAQGFRVAREQVLDRGSGKAFKIAVYRLRRDGKLGLREVAARAGISPSRVSQIQAEIESKDLDTEL